MSESPTAKTERPAILRTVSWGGLFEQPVKVVGETATRYRITPADKPVKLPERWLTSGNALVPKHAVRFT